MLMYMRSHTLARAWMHSRADQTTRASTQNERIIEGEHTSVTKKAITRTRTARNTHRVSVNSMQNVSPKSIAGPATVARYEAFQCQAEGVRV